VRISLDADSLSLLIRDDGVGCNGVSPHPPGRGVRNMEQRAKRIGAIFNRVSHVVGGCEIQVRLPLTAAADT
jgi:signal transduction histidine kinase